MVTKILKAYVWFFLPIALFVLITLVIAHSYPEFILILDTNLIYLTFAAILCLIVSERINNIPLNRLGFLILYFIFSFIIADLISHGNILKAVGFSVFLSILFALKTAQHLKE